MVIERDGGYAWVEAARRSNCGQCASQGGCGGLLARALGATKSARVRARNDARAQPGDQVVLGIDERALLRGSLLVYLVPIMGLIVLAILGSLAGERWLPTSSDLVGAAAGGLGFAAGLGWVRVLSHRVINDIDFQPVVLRRLPPMPTA